MSVHCETRGNDLWVVRPGDWEINVTQLKIRHDELVADHGAAAELSELRMSALILADAVSRTHGGVHPEPRPGCGICAALVRFRAETGTSPVTEPSGLSSKKDQP